MVAVAAAVHQVVVPAAVYPFQCVAAHCLLLFVAATHLEVVADVFVDPLWIVSAGGVRDVVLGVYPVKDAPVDVGVDVDDGVHAAWVALSLVARTSVVLVLAARDSHRLVSGQEVGSATGRTSSCTRPPRPVRSPAGRLTPRPFCHSS